MRSFFVDISSALDKEFTLPKEESKHACKVLRMNNGDHLAIVNGKGDQFTGEIINANPKACLIKVIDHVTEKKDDFEIHIAIAPTKNIDRFEWFLEKSTELGIHRITPLICSNSERKVIKEDRLNKVLIAAMKQSKRLYLPKLDSLTEFNEFIKTNPAGLIAHCYDDEKRTFETQVKPTNCPILIGPEGDFTNLEIEKAFSFNYKPVTLGKTRLRTETAGLYACMMSKHKFE